MMQKVLHETCQQYIARRLSEGWRIVRQKGNHLVLSSPDGNILRPVDLRNDVETLRPSAGGHYTQLTPDPAGPNWSCVDEVESDEYGTVVYVDGAFASGRDLYNLPAHSEGSGTINKITVYFRCHYWDCEGYAKAVIGSNATITYGSAKLLTEPWFTYSQEWALNPADNEAWEWSDMDVLEIGVYLECGECETAGADCTQLYVEIDYTPEAPPPEHIPRHSGAVGVLMF